MGWKSPMCEHGCRASHNEGHDGQNIRPRQLRNREVRWEGSQRSKLMSRRTERPYKVDGADKLARHSAVRCSAPEINGPVVQREFTFLLSPLSRLRMKWDHEPDRFRGVRIAAQRDRCKCDASDFRTARYSDWFRLATCEMNGELTLPAGKTCPSRS